MNDVHTVIALPSGHRAEVPRGTSLRAALRGLGVEIESICAENASCGKCKVLVEQGAFPDYGVTSSPSSLSAPQAEELDYLRRRAEVFERRGWQFDQVRLSCQARVLGDLVVTVPEESRADRQVIRKSASARPILVRPLLRKYLVEMTPPNLSSPRSDWERLASGLATSMGLVRSGEAGLPRPGDLAIDISCLRDLPEILRAANWRVTVSVRGDSEVVRVEPGLVDGLIGAAVDIGTTTMAVYLCELSTGETLSTASAMNPQIAFGEDVMSRIQFSSAAPDGLQQLHKAVIRTLNKLLLHAAADAVVGREDILDIVVVGNTTMEHLFLNIAPRYLGTAPFVPATSRSIDLKARDLRIAVNAAANVHVLPAIASFIGADTTAVLLAQEPHEQDEDWLIIDIGTNAELVLGNRRRMLCASTPTGPALEGAHIEHGMRAAAGAIEHLRIRGQNLDPEWKIIGEADWGMGRPKGLCGSAVVDAVAELVRAEVIDSSGRILRRADVDRVREGPSGPEFVIARADETSINTDIALNQKDVRQIQLAKAALYVAAESLLEEYGIKIPEKLMLAGAFGSFIDKEKAMAIGMLPAMDLDRVLVVGNAAGDGARIALLNREMRQSAPALATRLERYELPADPAFQARFLRALAFPPQAAHGERQP